MLFKDLRFRSFLSVPAVRLSIMVVAVLFYLAFYFLLSIEESHQLLDSVPLDSLYRGQTENYVARSLDTYYLCIFTCVSISLMLIIFNFGLYRYQLKIKKHREVKHG